jgi:15-cis-phytoene synthase
MLQASFATPADMAACRQMIRQGSKSFHLASLLLPAKYREDARCLYGFCRMADDLVDQADDPQAATAELKRRLDAIYAGTPGSDATDRAFADVVLRFGIPRAVPDALIEGFVWDAEGKHYETLSDVTAYAVRVAGTVGIMMSLIMGTRDPQALARAVDLGVAMQFSNIARDVVEDAAIGRVYLPEAWLRDDGKTTDDVLRKPIEGASSATCLVRLAEELYAQAMSGIALLPKRCRSSINCARLLYRAIGLKASAIGHGSRAIVSGREKLVLVSKALAQVPFLPKPEPMACLDEAQFLLDAVAQMSEKQLSRKGIDGQIGWVVDMFHSIEARKS